MIGRLTAEGLRHRQTLIPAFTDNYNELAIKSLFHARKTGEKWGC